MRRAGVCRVGVKRLVWWFGYVGLSRYDHSLSMRLSAADLIVKTHVYPIFWRNCTRNS
jgi:hypothetical protein